MSGARDGAARPLGDGLQLERTLLAWRRTALSLAVGGAVVARYAAERTGAVGASAAAAGVVCACAAYVAAALRYRRAHRGLAHRADRLTTGAAPLAALAASSALLALAVAGYVVVGWVGPG